MGQSGHNISIWSLEFFFQFDTQMDLMMKICRVKLLKYWCY
jgi:hypothetical protein